MIRVKTTWKVERFFKTCGCIQKVYIIALKTTQQHHLILLLILRFLVIIRTFGRKSRWPAPLYNLYLIRYQNNSICENGVVFYYSFFWKHKLMLHLLFFCSYLLWLHSLWKVSNARITILNNLLSKPKNEEYSVELIFHNGLPSSM